MKIILLDGSRINDISDLHEEFIKALGFDEDYGKNLDALYDELTCIGSDTGVIAVNTEELDEKLGRRWQAFLRLMRDVEAEVDGFYFCADPFGIE